MPSCEAFRFSSPLIIWKRQTSTLHLRNQRLEALLITMLGNIVGTACLVAVGCSAHALDSRSTINTTACADTHLIIARGSTESYPGTLGALADLIIGNITSGSADYENVIYPAVDETSSDSYFIGRAAFASQLKTYADACRDSKIVILSYSQVHTPQWSMRSISCLYTY